MRDVLGFNRFLAGGGDWGSLVSAELGHAHPEHVAGVHLTLPIFPGIDPRTVVRTDFDENEGWMIERIEQARPVSISHIEAHRQSAQTLAYAFEDSPAGLAAWLWERRCNWSDPETISRSLDPHFLCTTASIYWFTRSIGSSMRLYAAQVDAGWPLLHDCRPTIAVPTGFAVAPKELFMIPRRLAEERTRLERWTLLPRGGHFLPVEAPELLIEEYRAFARPLR